MCIWSSILGPAHDAITKYRSLMPLFLQMFEKIGKGALNLSNVYNCIVERACWLAAPRPGFNIQILKNKGVFRKWWNYPVQNGHWSPHHYRRGCLQKTINIIKHSHHHSHTLFSLLHLKDVYTRAWEPLSRGFKNRFSRCLNHPGQP